MSQGDPRRFQVLAPRELALVERIRHKARLQIGRNLCKLLLPRRIALVTVLHQVGGDGAMLLDLTSDPR